MNNIIYTVSSDSIFDLIVAIDRAIIDDAYIYVNGTINIIPYSILMYLSDYNDNIKKRIFNSDPNFGDKKVVGISSIMSSKIDDIEKYHELCTGSRGHVADYLLVPIGGITNVIFYHEEYSGKMPSMSSLSMWLDGVLSTCNEKLSNKNILLIPVIHDVITKEFIDIYIDKFYDLNSRFMVSLPQYINLFDNLLRSDIIITNNDAINRLLSSYEGKVLLCK